MSVLKLTTGERVLVDPDVWVWASKVSWRGDPADTKTYVTYRGRQDGRQHRVFLHRIILGLAPDDPRQGDHRNGDTFDNRRLNLRAVTPAQNAQNQGSRGGSSEYRGVTWDKARQKWMARGMLNGRHHTIGRFDDEDEAGSAAAEWRAEHMPFSAEAA